MDRRDMKADSILMHKERNIIAVRAVAGDQTVVQVFDIEASKKLKQAQVPDIAVYWRWIGLSKLAVVGKNAVWHIEINGTEECTKIFDRAP